MELEDLTDLMTVQFQHQGLDRTRLQDMGQTQANGTISDRHRWAKEPVSMLYNSIARVTTAPILPALETSYYSLIAKIIYICKIMKSQRCYRNAGSFLRRGTLKNILIIATIKCFKV